MRFAPTTLGPASRTAFYISPAVGGKNVWDLALDGDLTLNGNMGSDGVWTLVPLGGYVACQVTLWGGGSAGKSSSTIYTPNEDSNGGGDSTFIGMTAGGAPEYTYGSGSYTTPAAPGSASGGDTNTSGNSGGNADIIGGDGHGAGAPDGGGNSSGNGTAPGGGGAGGEDYDGFEVLIGKAAGGSSGAKCVKLFDEGDWTGLQVLTVGHGAPGQGGQDDGSPGRAIITLPP